MHSKPNSPDNFVMANKGLRREGFRSHFLLFVINTVLMGILIVCGVAGVVLMDGERYSTPPFYVATFLSATCIMANATIGGCFSVHGLYVKIKPDEPETALVILHLVVSIVSLVGYFVSIIVFGVSEVLGPCSSSNDTPGCSRHAQTYKALGAITLVIILISIATTFFGIYLYFRFGKEFGVSPYRKSKPKFKKPPEPPGSMARSISVHHNETNEMNQFI